LGVFDDTESAENDNLGYRLGLSSCERTDDAQDYHDTSVEPLPSLAAYRRLGSDAFGHLGQGPVKNI
jgi:hypothetical protein